MIGDILQDTYRIERLIGKGTMGVVYEASHLRFSRRFAIKVLTPALTADKEMLARFRQEAEVTGGLGHPHILQVIDFNTFKGCPYIVMELLVGENLGQRLEREGTLGVNAVSSIFSQVASALEAVHGCGIVHRDLKPSNIFLCYDGRNDDFVRLLDFGISKVLGAGANLTGTNVVLGSPHYMAPEQAVGRSADVDRRADIYAMGAIVYEMLAGRAPFESAETLTELLQLVVDEKPKPLRALRPDVPPGLDRVVTRALEKDASRRFDTMADFWVAFEDALGRSRRGVELSVTSARAATDQWAPEPSAQPVEDTMPLVEPWARRPVDDVERTIIDDRPPPYEEPAAPLQLLPTDPGFDREVTAPGMSEQELDQELETTMASPPPALAPSDTSVDPLPAIPAPAPSGRQGLSTRQRWVLTLVLLAILSALGGAVGVILWAVS